MVDIDRAMKSFNLYLKDYNIEDGKIELKIRHTMGVVKISEYICKELSLSKEDTNLAMLIALLHDIGRFKQVTIYNNFVDYQTVDHANLGEEILFKDRYIREFIRTNKFDDIIAVAIRNHNKLKIEDDLKEREMLHAQIIRDADKTDNFRVKAQDNFEDILNTSIEELEYGDITDKIYNDFMNSKIIISNERESKIDFWISYLAFIFDYNFIPGLRYIKEKDYINTIIDRIDYKNPDTKMKMEQIRKHATNFINKRIENG